MSFSQGSHSPFGDEGVKLVSYCPLCEASYNPEEAKVLGENHDSHLMHIRCGNCSNAVLALVLVSGVGVSSVGMVTDLAHDEVDRFKQGDSVSTDDVIDMHRMLVNQNTLWDAVLA